MSTEKIRTIIIALIFSVTLNIGLALNLFIEKVPAPFSHSREKFAVVEMSNGGILKSMSKLSFRELVSFLTNKTAVEDGYTKRDLAVAALTAYHHFNLEKALSAKPEQLRKVFITKDETIEVYPSLNEEQFDAIIRFAYQEKWPLTTKGLFSHMKNQSLRDESLEQAFLHTPEFYAVQLLFQKTGAPQSAKTFLDLISEGKWELLEAFSKEEALSFDFSEEKRRLFLISYIQAGSSTAAELLLTTDFEFALKRLEDKEVLTLLPLLKKETHASANFCKALLNSPRSDAVWKAASTVLCSYLGEIPKEPFHPQEILSRYGVSSPKVEAGEPQKELQTSARYHIVKEGESLWKISRLYKVKVDEIVKLNGLEKDALFPGMTLKLPDEV